MRVTLHSLIAWPAPAFRNSPPDIVERALPLAGFAMQTVGWIGWLYFIVHRLVYTRRAECNTGTIEYGCAFGLANGRIQNRQM